MPKQRMFPFCVFNAFLVSFANSVASDLCLQQPFLPTPRTECRLSNQTNKMPSFHLDHFVVKYRNICQLWEVESNSCIQNISEPFWFGQDWKVYLPSCRATTLGQAVQGQTCSYYSTAHEALWLWTICSAPVKPQCSKPAGPQPFWIKHHKYVSFQGHLCFMMHKDVVGRGSTNLCFAEPAAQLPLVAMVKDTWHNWKMLMFWQVCFNPTNTKTIS